MHKLLAHLLKLAKRVSYFTKNWWKKKFWIHPQIICMALLKYVVWFCKLIFYLKFWYLQSTLFIGVQGIFTKKLFHLCFFKENKCIYCFSSYDFLFCPLPENSGTSKPQWWGLKRHVGEQPLSCVVKSVLWLCKQRQKERHRLIDAALGREAREL